MVGLLCVSLFGKGFVRKFGGSGLKGECEGSITSVGLKSLWLQVSGLKGLWAVRGMDVSSVCGERG